MFRLIGDCVGKTVEVDARTREKKVLKEGRVQVLFNSSTILPMQVPIWVDDLKFKVSGGGGRRQSGRGRGNTRDEKE